MMFTFLIMIPSSFFMITLISKEKLPQVQQSEIILYVDWNSNIGISENRNRINTYLNNLNDIISQSNAYIGEQQFLLNKDKELGYAESRIYIKVKASQNLDALKEITKQYFKEKHAKAIFRFEPYKTLFDKIFQDNQPDVLARITSSNRQLPKQEKVKEIEDYLVTNYNDLSISAPASQNHKVIIVKAENLVLYDVSIGTLFSRLKTAFNTLEIDVLKFRQNYLPIVIADNENTISGIINSLKVRNRNNMASFSLEISC